MSERYYDAATVLDDLAAAAFAVAFCDADNARAGQIAHRELRRQVAIARAILPEIFPTSDTRPLDQRRSQLLDEARKHWRRCARRSKHPCDAALRDALRRAAPALHIVRDDAA